MTKKEIALHLIIKQIWFEEFKTKTENAGVIIDYNPFLHVLILDTLGFPNDTINIGNDSDENFFRREPFYNLISDLIKTGNRPNKILDKLLNCLKKLKTNSTILLAGK